MYILNRWNPKTIAFSSNANTDQLTLGDYGAATSYLVNSPAGEYALFFTPHRLLQQILTLAYAALIYYQAGIAVISGNVWRGFFFENLPQSSSTQCQHGTGHCFRIRDTPSAVDLIISHDWLLYGCTFGRFN